MKNLCKIALLSMCIFLIAPSPSHADLDGLVYYLYVKGPKSIWTPTFEFQGGNDLLVIGASSNYGVLNGVWQEVPLGLFSFFWAQVEEDAPTTTTTTPPDETSGTSSLDFQPAQTEKTKYLINLLGLAFTTPAIGTGPTFSILYGGGDYLSAGGASFIGITSIPGPGADPEFVSINPVSGAQEEQLTVTITGSNTTFQDDFVTAVSFTPENNITVDSFNVQSNTEVQCDITIAANAEIGDYTVTVLYDGGQQFIIGTNVFEVTQ